MKNSIKKVYIYIHLILTSKFYFFNFIIRKDFCMYTYWSRIMIYASHSTLIRIKHRSLSFKVILTEKPFKNFSITKKIFSIPFSFIIMKLSFISISTLKSYCPMTFKFSIKKITCIYITNCFYIFFS